MFPLFVLPMQRSAVLEHIWNLEDIWSTPFCRLFIVQWAAMLESKVLIRRFQKIFLDQDIFLLKERRRLLIKVFYSSAEEADADRWLARDE